MTLTRDAAAVHTGWIVG